MFHTSLLITLFSLFSFLTGAETPTSEQKINLLFVGDAMQHQGQLDRALELGGGKRYNYDDCFTLIAPDIVKADYAICNLEVPLGGGPSYTGYPCFSAPDAFAERLKATGFDLFLTANNHCLDRSDKGVRRTISVLDSLRVDHIGTYFDAATRNATPPFIRNIKGIKIGFLNYTYGTNGIKPKSGAEIALIDKPRMAREIKALRSAGAEIVTVCIHWGVEYVLTENAEQRSIAQFLVDQGVDLIIGGHPHVIQPMKVIRNKKENKDVLVVYSLGNFISNMKTADTRGGALVNVCITRDKNGKAKFTSATYDTFFAAKPSGAGSNYMVIPSYKTDKIPAAQREHWLLFNRNAQRIFDTHNVSVPRRQYTN
jgi:poly-gamma-glutamate capsule biosynthesis protein CapA/YwtB (metallophosphatase superfamily)